MKDRPFGQCHHFTFAGIAKVWRREKSFRIQVTIAAAAVAALASIRPSLVLAGLVALCIALVPALDTVNSTIECMTDYIHPGVASVNRRAKDVAAAAVLVVSSGVAIVGLLMIVDRLRR